MSLLILFLLFGRALASEQILIDILTNSTMEEEQSDEITCDCTGDDMFEKANYTLQIEVKNMQVRLVEPFRDAIAYTSSEKQHLLDFVKYSILREMRSSYPQMLNYTDFYSNFNDLMGTFTNILNTENDISLSGIRFEVSTAIDKFFTELLPDLFLCLSVGKCRTVPSDYESCILSGTKHWSEYVGNTPHKMATTIAEAIYRYRKVESLLVDMHSQLMNAQNLTITADCLDDYVETLPCNCTAIGITRCKTSCSNAMESCFGKFSRDWSGKLHLMRNMTNTKKGYLENLMSLKKTIFVAIRMFVERRSYIYAEHVANACGPLGQLMIHPSQRSFTIRSPGPFLARSDKAVRELQLSGRLWERLGRKICEHATVVLNPVMCYDGVKVITVDQELPPITKDVRPRPMMEWIERKSEKKPTVEGSALNPLWDDEDSDDFEGSSSGMPPIIEQRPVEDHPKNIDLSTNPKGPSEIVTEQEGNLPDGTKSKTVTASLVIIATFWLL